MKAPRPSPADDAGLDALALAVAQRVRIHLAETVESQAALPEAVPETNPLPGGVATTQTRGGEVEKEKETTAATATDEEAGLAATSDSLPLSEAPQDSPEEMSLCRAPETH